MENNQVSLNKNLCGRNGGMVDIVARLLPV